MSATLNRVGVKLDPNNAAKKDGWEISSERGWGTSWEIGSKVVGK
jgi:hypothetical protein